MKEEGLKELIKPKEIKVEKGTLSNVYGKFIIEPLEKGWGITIGNALRRILLSSIPGSAITSVKIDGVPHEFYAIPGVKEDVLEIIAVEKPKGVIVQYGGQTPLKLARALEAAGAPMIGTSPDSIDRAEDRSRFQQLITQLGLRQPHNRTARSCEEALKRAEEIGYPLVVRPSYVLGGRAMEIVYQSEDFKNYMLQEKHVLLKPRYQVHPLFLHLLQPRGCTTFHLFSLSSTATTS